MRHHPEQHFAAAMPSPGIPGGYDPQLVGYTHQINVTPPSLGVPGLQAPQGLQMPPPLPLASPLAVPSLDVSLDPASPEQLNDLAAKGKQLEALQNYYASLQQTLQAERECASGSCDKVLMKLREEVAGLSPSLVALAENVTQSSQLAQDIHRWFVANGPRIRGYQESTDPSGWLAEDTKELLQKVDSLGLRWKQLQAVAFSELSPSRAVEVSTAASTTTTASTRFCPSGHAMSVFTAAKDGATCQICGALHAPGSVLMRCDLCGHEACMGCTAKAADLQVSASPLPAARDRPKQPETIPEDLPVSVDCGTPVGTPMAEPSEEETGQPQFTSFHIRR
ncbi:hypothetical protein AK812_SmicGene34567 [Symbiodinium microadriaticum]|uniref:Uncharacterized protein n=1 Tax=Symbiodinium microadriaticum TaxID=2951 RepID=A0A1Q9CNP2_SYMMI|nr:hypothetical protein AK812_SmicGene34567 [Symbiodinium microadriaticum]